MLLFFPSFCIKGSRDHLSFSLLKHWIGVMVVERNAKHLAASELSFDAALTTIVANGNLSSLTLAGPASSDAKSLLICQAADIPDKLCFNAPATRWWGVCYENNIYILWSCRSLKMASYICTTSWRGEIKLPWQAIEHRGTLQTSNLISSTGTSWFLLHQSVLVNLLSILWANQHDSLLFFNTASHSCS